MIKHLLACVFAAFILSGSALASGPAPERDQSRFEVGFLKSMIDHHYAAVKMAELCDGRTVHPELQEMCDQIKTAQTGEIATMQSWLQGWYGAAHAPNLDRKTRRQLAHLATLSAEAFEKKFMAAMIEHHSMAATMAIDCLNKAYHAEMLNMCAMMLGAQGDEIAQLRIWLQQWYQIDDLHRHDQRRARHGDHKDHRGSKRSA